MGVLRVDIPDDVHARLWALKLATSTSIQDLVVAAVDQYTEQEVAREGRSEMKTTLPVDMVAKLDGLTVLTGKTKNELVEEALLYYFASEEE